VWAYKIRMRVINGYAVSLAPEARRKKCGRGERVWAKGRVGEEEVIGSHWRLRRVIGRWRGGKEVWAKENK
jgi:hypothetical protein